MWNELGISGGTAIIILIAITGKKTDEDIQNEKELNGLGLDSEDQ